MHHHELLFAWDEYLVYQAGDMPDVSGSINSKKLQEDTMAKKDEKKKKKECKAKDVKKDKKKKEKKKGKKKDKKK